MMSALVAGSAWICPPTEGAALEATAALAALPVVRGVVAVVVPLVVPAGLLPLLALALSAAKAARKVVASCTASAFLRYTTWMLPLAPVLLGRSSLLTSERTSATRAGLAARRISALLRGSGNSTVLNEVSAPPAAPVAAPLAAPLPSIRRCTSGARSLASACCSGITSTSLALDTSMAATMRPRRRRLSA